MKRIIITTLILLMISTVALADIYPREVKPGPYGLEPNECAAIIGFVFAYIHNFGLYYDKKRKDKSLEYNYAFLHSTTIAAVGVALVLLELQIVEFGLGAILLGISYGIGGNFIVKEHTKGTR